MTRPSAVVVAAAAVALTLIRSGAAASPLADACEAALRERMAPPSTLHRTTVEDEERSPISLDQYFSANPQTPDVQGFYRTLGKHPVRLSAKLKFEGTNSAGAALQSSVQCSYDDVDGGNGGDVSKINVRIDGKTNLDLLVRRPPAAR